MTAATTGPHSPGRAVPERGLILETCRALIEARKKENLTEMESLDAAAAAETKSSAGDKYETGRELLAQARKVIERNLAEAETGLAALDRMAAAVPGAEAAFGSLVGTSMGWFLLGASLGESDSPQGPVRTISLASPLGAALKGRTEGDRIPWRGAVLEILNIPR